jgi:anti-anti-sigma factor
VVELTARRGARFSTADPGRKFTVTAMIPASLRDVHLPTADDVQRHGRAEFLAYDVDAARVMIVVKGEVDATNRHALGRFVERYTGVSKQLVLDLTSVDFFGSQGFTALYFVSVHCARRDVDWMVVGSPTVMRILRICDPDGELPLIDDLSDALSRLDHVAKSHQPIEWSG